RRRRRELAVLRAVGFTGGEVRAAVRWQAAIIAMVAGVVGLPVGIVLGRLAWTALADRLGTTAGPVVPVTALAALVAGTLLVALAVAETPARHAARVRPALVLRAE
ncbi:MAG TPA: ABC transporter permease, partial [Acidimicrobiia bacterium]